MIVDVESYSDFARLIRVTALVLRFLNNLKTKKRMRLSGSLTTEEFDNAKRMWLIEIQKQSACNLPNIPFGAKHPILLPQHHHLTSLIIRDCHHRVEV